MLKIPIELITWVAGLLYLGCVPPGNFSFCIFHHLGFSFCPGCGLGHSIYYLLHGQWEDSIHAHPLGIIATAILFHRIYILCKSLNYFKLKSSH